MPSEGHQGLWDSLCALAAVYLETFAISKLQRTKSQYAEVELAERSAPFPERQPICSDFATGTWCRLALANNYLASFSLKNV